MRAAQRRTREAAVGATTPALTRRQLLASAGSAAAIAIYGTGCAETARQARSLTGPLPLAYLPLSAEPQTLKLALHAVARAGFGPLPGDVTRAAIMGPRAWVEQQLTSWGSIPEDPAVDWRVNALDTHQTQQEAPDAMMSMEYDQLLAETAQAAVLRARFSTRQLKENLIDFWTNHFNIYALKSDGQALVPTDIETVIRANFDSFPNMLRASAHSPAMLNYLDNKFNEKGVANENYARELLELHTLGVDSGYTLTDIKQVARCFTGWTVKTGWQRGQFVYTDNLHDKGSKYIPFLNLTIAPNGGQKDADAVIETLAYHPATAHFLARKLCKHFLGTVPLDTQDAAVRAYLGSNGRISCMLRPILLDALFSTERCQPIIKRPLNMTVSALRALNADTDGARPIQVHLDTMGQPLYQWPMPDGYPEKASAWAANLLPRWNFSLALTANTIPGTTTNLPALFTAAGISATECGDAGILKLSELVLNTPANVIQQHSPQLVAAMKQHAADAAAAHVKVPQILAECTALLLSSPEFQWK